MGKCTKKNLYSIQQMTTYNQGLSNVSWCGSADGFSTHFIQNVTDSAEIFLVSLKTKKAWLVGLHNLFKQMAGEKWFHYIIPGSIVWPLGKGLKYDTILIRVHFIFRIQSVEKRSSAKPHQNKKLTTPTVLLVLKRRKYKDWRTTET